MNNKVKAEYRSENDILVGFFDNVYVDTCMHRITFNINEKENNMFYYNDVSTLYVDDQLVTLNKKEK